MDLYLGVPSVILDSASKDRRLLYGKAGCFRNKPYGVEYRSLSNFWAFERKYINWIFDTVDAVTKDLVLNYNIKFTEEMEKNIVNCINNSDVELAKKICEEFSIELPSLEDKCEAKANIYIGKGKSNYHKYMEEAGVRFEMPIVDMPSVGSGLWEQTRQQAVYTVASNRNGTRSVVKSKSKPSSSDAPNF
jgi:hypothetical protein